MLVAALLAGCAEKPESMVSSAKDYLAKNDRNAAIIQLKNALQKNPDLAEARFLLGKASLDAGDIPSAEKELRRAMELGYPTDQVVPALARALLARGDYKKLVDEFAKFELPTPESKADLQSTLADAWSATGNRDAAHNALAAALAAVPDYPRAVVGDARRKAASGDLDGGLALVDGVVARSPKLVEAWQLKGDIEVAQGKTDVALASYRRALDARPDHLPAHAAIVTILLQQGKTDAAVTQVDAMKKIAPKHPQTLLLQASVAYAQKNYPAAREAIQQQLRMAPDNLLGLMMEGSVEYQLGAYVQAERSLLKVLQRAPGQKMARRLLVATYLRTGQLSKAQDALKPLLDDEHVDGDLLALAGEVAMRNGDAAEAGRHFAKAAALDPKSTPKRTALAAFHVATGDSERGLRELEQAAAADTGVRADLALIMANIQQRKFDAALTAIGALEKKQPDKPLAHNLRAAVLMAKGDTAGARRSLQRAAEIDPSDFASAAGLARLDIADKRPADARKRFDAVLAKNPKDVRALLAIAELRAQEGGSPDEVAKLIGKAIDADPTSSAPRLALISFHLRNNEAKKALAAAQDAVAALPDRPDVLLAAAQAQQAAGEGNQAIQTYNKLAQLRPGSPSAYLGQAQVQLGANDSDAALQSLRRALSVKPDLLDAQRTMIAIHVKAGRTKEAVAVARQVQKQRVKEPIGYIFEGDIHAARKAWPDAVAAYRAGMKQVDATELAVRLDSALRAAGNVAEADNQAASWLKSHPRDQGFRMYMAQVTMARNDLAGAARQYRTVLEADPNNVVALNNLAWISWQLKDPKALGYAEQAVKLAPKNPAVLDTLGVLLVEKGDAKRGIELLQEALAISPNAGAIRLNLARALVKGGQKSEAKKELEVLAKLGDKFPGQQEVAKLMKEL